MNQTHRLPREPRGTEPRPGKTPLAYEQLRCLYAMQGYTHLAYEQLRCLYAIAFLAHEHGQHDAR